MFACFCSRRATSAAVQDSKDGKLSMNMVQQGATLDKHLIVMDDKEDEENQLEISARRLGCG